MLVPNDKIVEVIQRHSTARIASRLVRALSSGGHASRQAPGGRIRRNHVASTVEPRTDREFLDHVVTFCQGTLDPDAKATVYLEIGDLLKGIGALDYAGEMYSEVLHSRRAGKPSPAGAAHRAEALLRRGEIRSSLGHWSASRKDLLQSRVLFASLKQPVAVGRVDNILGTNSAERGKLSQARRLFRQAYAAFEDAGRTDLTGMALMNMGILFNIQGRYDEALTSYRRALTLFEQSGDLRRLSQLHHNQGMTYLLQGRPGDALKEFDLAHQVASKESIVPIMANALLGKGTVQYRQGDLRLALALVRQAITLFEQCGDRLGQADGYKLQGMIHRDQGAYHPAASYFHTSLRLNRELENVLNAAETLLELGTLERKRHCPEAAVAAFAEARTLFKKVGAREQAERAEHHLRGMHRRNHVA